MREEELIELMDRYLSSGTIDDALIPYFDQDGNWVGDVYRWTPIVWRMSGMSMRGASLPSSRRTERCASGVILRTSFVWKNATALSLNYCSVEGSIVVAENVDVKAACLRQIGGGFHAQSESTIFLPILTSVVGDFYAPRCLALTAPRLRHVEGNLSTMGDVLPRLETVGGRYELQWAFDVHAPRLRRVGGGFAPHKCTELVAPLLETVGGELLTPHPAKKIHAPNLTSVGGGFDAGSAVNIEVPKLRVVGGDFNTLSAEKFYHPDIAVSGEWFTYPGAKEAWHERQRIMKSLRGRGVDFGI